MPQSVPNSFLTPEASEDDVELECLGSQRSPVQFSNLKPTPSLMNTRRA